MPRRPDHPSRDRPRPEHAGKHRPHRPHAAAGKPPSDQSRSRAARPDHERSGEARGRPDREQGRKEWRRGKEHGGGHRPDRDARPGAEGAGGEARPGRDRKPFRGQERGRPWKDRNSSDRPARDRDERPRKEPRFGRSGPSREDARDKPRWEKREARSERESRRQSGWSRPQHGSGPAPRGGSAPAGPRDRLELAARPEEKLVRIAGLPSVAQLFETAPNRVERLYFEADRKGDVEGWCDALARRHKVYRQVGAEEMKRVAGTAMHGGVVALAHPRAIHELDLGEAEAWGAAGKPLLILDGVGNPQNVGAIARTAAFLGVERLVLSDHPEQAGLSDTSYRVAKGALEHIQLYRARGIVDVLARLRSRYDVVGTAIGRGKSLASQEKTGKPVALVLGNEEAGLSPATLAACTSVVSIPGSGKVQSLNVSATAAILIYELLRRG